MTNTVGFIGAGRMGGAIALRIASDPAWDVLVSDPSAEALRRFDGSRARVAASAREIAERCAYVLSSLPLPEDVERLYSAAGIAGAIRSTASLWSSARSIRTRAVA